MPVFESYDLSEPEEYDEKDYDLNDNEFFCYDDFFSAEPSPQLSDERELLVRLLDLSTPIISKSMLAFLNQEDVCLLFMDFIVRRPENYEGNYLKFEIPTFVVQSRNACPIRVGVQYSEEKTLKRAYSAMVLFCRNEILVKWILNNFELLATCLFKIFDKSSLGVFHHFFNVFRRLIQICPSRMLRLLARNEGEFLRLLVDNCFHYPVMESLLLIFNIKGTEDQERETVFQLCGSLSLVEYLGLLVCEKDIGSQAEILLKSLPAQCSSLKYVSLLFGSTHAIKSLVEVLISKIVDPEVPLLKKQECLNALWSYYTFWQDIARKTQNSQLRFDTIGELLFQYLNEITNFIAEYRSTNLDIFNFLTSEFVYSIITRENFQLPSKIEFDLIAPKFWSTLTHWFLKYEDNDIFHSLFFRFFSICLRSRHSSTLEHFVVEPKLIENLFKIYHSSDGRKGISLVMCSFIQLASESSSSTSKLNQILNENNTWMDQSQSIQKDVQEIYFGGKQDGSLSYLPTLIDSLSYEKKLKGEDFYSSSPLRLPQTPTSTLYKTVPYKFRINNYSLPKDLNEKSFSLGSTYAIALGFTNEAPENSRDTIDFRDKRVKIDMDDL